MRQEIEDECEQAGAEVEVSGCEVAPATVVKL